MPTTITGSDGTSWEIIIGMEVHAQIISNSKLFSGASTTFGATSVGTLSIRRFLRPVCYQNMPTALLPEDLL